MWDYINAVLLWNSPIVETENLMIAAQSCMEIAYEYPPKARNVKADYKVYM